MDMLWLRMAEIYGHKWVSSYGEKPNHAWTSGLSDICPESIKYGIEAIINSGEPWPPSLPEFVDYCLGVSRSDIVKEIHDRYVGKTTTFAEIDKLERIQFKEVRLEMLGGAIGYEKSQYLKSLSSDQLKALTQQPYVT